MVRRRRASAEAVTLEAVITRHALRRAGAPPGRGKAVVLLIHGRGATAESILPLGEVLAFPDFTYLAPQAEDHSWYPQSFMAPTAANEPFLSRSLQRIADIIADIVAACTPAERLAIIGFSQGACLASETVLRNPRPYGLLGVLSGGAIGPTGTPRDYAGSLAGLHAVVACADQDPHIPLPRVKETSAVLARLGASVTERIYPGSFHGVNDDEITCLRAGLAPLTA